MDGRSRPFSLFRWLEIEDDALGGSTETHQDWRLTDAPAMHDDGLNAALDGAVLDICAPLPSNIFRRPIHPSLSSV